MSHILTNESTAPRLSHQPDTPGTTSSGLKTRLISAAVGIPIVLLAILAGVPGISAITIAASLAAGYELSQMMREHPRTNIRYIVVVTALASSGTAAATGTSEIAVALFAFGAAAGLAGIFTTATTRWPGRTKALFVGVAALYFGIALAHAAPLAAEDDGRRWILLAILGTFAIDTGAYFVGRAIGRHKLAPKISPKKTWEGVLGGVAAAIGAVIALGAVFDLPLSIWEAALLGLALTISGVLGDLFESWLKRKANVKDSGRIIPGHGGILDRIDSLAPNLVVVYWAVQLLEI